MRGILGRLFGSTRTGRDAANWHVRWQVDKYREDIAGWRGREADFHALFRPYETLAHEGNLLVN